MTYAAYLKKYNKLIARFVKLGAPYIRKVFWRLRRAQVKMYAAIQLKTMRAALRNLEG